MPYRTTRNALIFLKLSLIGVVLKFVPCLLLGLDRDVDVTDLKVHLCHQVDPCDLGDDGQGFWRLPRVVYEWSIPPG